MKKAFVIVVLCAFTGLFSYHCGNTQIGEKKRYIQCPNEIKPGDTVKALRATNDSVIFVPLHDTVKITNVY